MKLVVNTLLGLGMQALAEAIALGEEERSARICFSRAGSELCLEGIGPLQADVEVFDLRGFCS